MRRVLAAAEKKKQLYCNYLYVPYTYCRLVYLEKNTHQGTMQYLCCTHNPSTKGAKLILCTLRGITIHFGRRSILFRLKTDVNFFIADVTRG